MRRIKKIVASTRYIEPVSTSSPASFGPIIWFYHRIDYIDYVVLDDRDRVADEAMTKP